MKTFAAMFIATLAAASVLIADEALTMTGGTAGRTIAVTTNAVRVTISPAARLVSVSNAGSAVVYLSIRTTSAEHAAMVASTNATPVNASTIYELVGGAPIDSVTIQSATAATNSVTIGVQK